MTSVVSVLSAISPKVAALVVGFWVIRLMVRHDQAVLRLVLSLVVLIGNGPRSKRALLLLQLHRKTSPPESTGNQEK